MTIKKYIKSISNHIQDWIIFFFLILGVSGLSSFTVQMISTGLPLYCIDIGKTTAQAGIISAFYSIAVIISKPFVGKWIDERGKWIIAFIGIILMVLSLGLMAFVPNLSLFGIYQFIEGVSFSALSTALAALLMDIFPPESMVKGIGLFTVIKSFTISLGASFAVSFIEKNGSSKLFICCFIILLIAFVITIFLKKAPVYNKTYIKEETQSVEYKGLDKFIDKSALPICLVQFVFTFSLTLGTCYLPSYAQSIGLAGVGSYYIVSAVTMLLTRTIFSKVIEKLNTKLSFIIGMFLAAITTVGVLFSDKLIYFILLAIPNAIGIALINPTLNVLATAYAPANRRGVASSTYYASLDLGSGAGSTIWGILVPVIGYNYSFILATVLLMIVFIYGIRLVRK